MASRDRLTLVDARWRGPGLHLGFDLAGHRFLTSVWYGDVDLDALEARIGQDALACLAFHAAAFEIDKLFSLRPAELSFGPLARFVTPRFVTLYREVVTKIWAQWRYEHDLPDWTGPELVDPPIGATVPASLAPREDDAALLFFGGGKDSLVAARLFADAGLPWASLSYAHSAYGPPEAQMRLVDEALAPLSPVARHRQWVADTAFAAPLPTLLPERGVRSFLAGETPSSIMEALPIAIAHGHRHVALAHEHSANRGNLVWSRTGEEINHQWGKSWEAEALLSRYVDEQLVPGLRWFSVLQPLSDVLIFELLRGAGDAVLATHSCNVAKPWCHRCAKCCYVALGYAAHLPDGVYEQVFAEDVLDLPENEGHFRELAGLAAHTPFECVGEIDESRLALALCAARGRTSRAVRLFQREIGQVDVASVLARYGVVHAPHGIPDAVASRVLPAMRAAEGRASERIRGLLGVS
jgi:hypothetical protein